MKLYQTRPVVAGALSSALSPRLLESQVLLLHHAPYKSSLMTYLGQCICYLLFNQNIPLHILNTDSVSKPKEYGESYGGI